MTTYSVGILLFNEVEVLDFAGPFEVFSTTTDANGEHLFDVHTVSQDGKLISARNGLKVQPDFSFENHPCFDIVIVPGGYGAEHIEINNITVIEWIKQQQIETQFMTSVCTGAFLLAKAGVLNGLKATTHWADLERLQDEFPQISVRRHVKFVDEGRILTSAGVSAGINMSFHLIRRLYSKEIAIKTAQRMEYDVDL